MKRLAGALGLFVAAPLLADTAALTWANPTQYTDGMALNQAIAQTNVRCTALVMGTTRNACSLTDQKVPGAGTSYSWTYTITASSSGNICFAVQTMLADGSTSDWSNEGCKAFTYTTRKSKPPVLTVK